MKVDTTQQLLQIQLMSQMMKSASNGNESTFNMVMTSLLNSLQSNGTDVSGLNLLSSDSSNLTTGNYEPMTNLKQDINSDAARHFTMTCFFVTYAMILIFGGMATFT